jgi:hypothetical protein
LSEGENEPLPVQAVCTRSQFRQLEEQEKADDEATTASCATPVDLDKLDDSLFGVSKEQQKLTKSEKRRQAQERLTAIKSPQRLVELSREDIVEAQHDDDRC